MIVPSVGFDSGIFELRLCQRELKLALKVSRCSKNVNSLQLGPYKISKVHHRFRKAIGQHHSSRNLLPNALVDAGASQGLCAKFHVGTKIYTQNF